MASGRAARIAGRARSAGTRIQALLRTDLPTGRWRLVALNAIVVVAFSAVTVDALTRSARVPAQGTLRASLHPHQRGNGHASSNAIKGGAEDARANTVADTGSSGRRLLAPGVVVSRPRQKHVTRNTTGHVKSPVHKVSGKTTPGSLAPSPVDMTVAYPADSTTVAVGSALGLNDTPGDTAAEARAVVSWLNDNGGIGGHPARLRLITYDPAQGNGIAAAFGSACAAAATGPKPLAVFAPLQDTEVERSCLASHHMLLVGDGPAPGDTQVFSKPDGLFAPGSMSLNRIAREEVSYLADKKFLTKTSRVGIVRIDAPIFARASRDTLRPAIEAAGSHVVAEAVIPRPYAVTDVPAALAAARAAVLQLRTAAVDRVVMLDAGVAAPLFMRVAQRQIYTPRYGLNSTMAPARLVDLVSPTQLTNAIGVGYSPALDVAAAEEPAASGARSQCDGILKGVDVGGESITGRYSALALCGQMLTVRMALAGDRDPTTARLSSALEHLDPAPSVLALSSRLDATHHDGAASVRELVFDSGCTCMRYASDARDSL